jgi:hypothetical protein
MATPMQTSGAISLADIASKWGGSAPHSLSEYYGKDGNHTTSYTSVPNSGQISIGNFYGTQPGYPEAQSPTGYTVYNGSGNFTVNNSGNVTYVELYGGGGGGHWGRCGGNGGHGWGVISRRDIGNGTNTVYVTSGANGGISGTGGASYFGNYMRANGGVGISGSSIASATSGNFQILNAGNSVSSPSWDNTNPSNDGTGACNANNPQRGGAVIYY